MYVIRANPNWAPRRYQMRLGIYEDHVKAQLYIIDIIKDARLHGNDFWEHPKITGRYLCSSGGYLQISKLKNWH